MLSRPIGWFADINFDDTNATKARIAAEFDGWVLELTALITDGESAPILRSIHELPDRHQWTRVPGVTFLGDAAHVTLPEGEGANLAMLGRCRTRASDRRPSDDIEAALTAYEQVMFPRSEAEAIAAHETIELIFGAGAPTVLADLSNGTTDSAAV